MDYCSHTNSIEQHRRHLTGRKEQATRNVTCGGCKRSKREDGSASMAFANCSAVYLEAKLLIVCRCECDAAAQMSDLVRRFVPVGLCKRVG